MDFELSSALKLKVEVSDFARANIFTTPVQVSWDEFFL